MLPRRRLLGSNLHEGIGLNFVTGQYYTREPGRPANLQPLTSLFTFTGGNQSLFRGPSGLLVQSVTNTPRIEYDASGNCLGLLMEASRTNGLLQSRDFTNASWVKTTMTAAKNQTGADGTANGASSLTATAGNGTALQTIIQAAVNSTLSFDIRRITGSGTIGICQDGATFTDVTAQINSTTFTRVTLTASQLNPVLGIRLGTNGDSIAVDFGQFEAGAFASSRIPTTTVSVARTADSCIRTLGSEFSATAGTVVVAGRASGGQDAAAVQYWWIFNNGVSFNDNTRLVRPAASDNARFGMQSGGVSQFTSNFNFTNSAAFKAAAAWQASDSGYSFNGAAANVLGAVSLPTGITTLNLGMNTGGAEQMNGHIRTFDYWPTRLPNTYLVSAST